MNHEFDEAKLLEAMQEAGACMYVEGGATTSSKAQYLANQ